MKTLITSLAVLALITPTLSFASDKPNPEQVQSFLCSLPKPVQFPHESDFLFKIATDAYNLVQSHCPVASQTGHSHYNTLLRLGILDPHTTTSTTTVGMLN